MRHWPKTSRSAKALAGLAVTVVVGATVFVVLYGGGGNSASPSDPASPRSPAAGFAALSAAHTNRCDLAAGEVRAMAGSMRLQGSCCFPMDPSGYKSQLKGLGHYRGAERDLVPANPYDVRVAMARRLLSYRSISLTTSQQALYRRATAKSSLGGPCCCHCWRWQAFRGQAAFLIARRNYSAAQVARLWELEAGCGGAES